MCYILLNFEVIVKKRQDYKIKRASLYYVIFLIKWMLQYRLNVSENQE